MNTTEQKPKLALVGEDGNAFAILARSRAVMKRAGYPKERIEEFMKEAMAGDYNHLLRTCMDWFDTTEDDEKGGE